MLNLKYSAQTDVGPRREHNEDAILVIPAEAHPQGDFVALVADGMGGEAAGEVASSMIVQRFESRWPALRAEGRSAHEVLSDILNEANRELLEASSREQGRRGMGSTAVALVIDREGSAVYAHVGDSRLYRLVDDTLEQLTVDHTRVQLLVSSGMLTREQAATHPEANVLSQAMGRRGMIVDTARERRLAAGATSWLLCSDGVSNCLSTAVLTLALRSLPAEEAAAELIRLCYLHGATDNVSAIVVRDGAPVAPLDVESFRSRAEELMELHDPEHPELPEYNARSSVFGSTDARVKAGSGGLPISMMPSEALQPAHSSSDEPTVPQNADSVQAAPAQRRMLIMVGAVALLLAIVIVALLLLSSRGDEAQSGEGAPRVEAAEGSEGSEGSAPDEEREAGPIVQRSRSASLLPDVRAWFVPAPTANAAERGLWLMAHELSAGQLELLRAARIDAGSPLACEASAALAEVFPASCHLSADCSTQGDDWAPVCVAPADAATICAALCEELGEGWDGCRLPSAHGLGVLARNAPHGLATVDAAGMTILPLVGQELAATPTVFNLYGGVFEYALREDGSHGVFGLPPDRSHVPSDWIAAEAVAQHIGNLPVGNEDGAPVAIGMRCVAVRNGAEAPEESAQGQAQEGSGAREPADTRREAVRAGEPTREVIATPPPLEPVAPPPAQEPRRTPTPRPEPVHEGAVPRDATTIPPGAN